jgi:hypothetical protein
MIEPQTIHKPSHRALTETLDTHFPTELKPHFVEDSSGLHKEHHQEISHKSTIIDASKVIAENENEADQEYIEDNFEDDYA